MVDHLDERVECEWLIGELTQLRNAMLANAAEWEHHHQLLYPSYCESAANLLHYLTLRRRNLRDLQVRLSRLGLSSLGRCESQVLANVDAVLTTLRLRLADSSRPYNTSRDGSSILAEHTKNLLGPRPKLRSARILVTMPAEAADDPQLVHRLLAAGMDCARINCAHDTPSVWQRIIKNLRSAEASLHRSCQVIMDLGGPKLRTGPLPPGPAVLKVRPQRDAMGRVIRPARVTLLSDDGTADADRPPLGDWIPVDPDWQQQLAVGDQVALRDARGRSRRMTIVDRYDRGWIAESQQTIYFTPGTVLQTVRCARPDDNLALNTCPPTAAGRVGRLPATVSRLRLRVGDDLHLTRALSDACSAVLDSQGAIVTPASIGCTLPSIFADVQVGESIWFDDGKLGGLIVAVSPDLIKVRITSAGPKGSWLAADKGINLPETKLRLPALTSKDRKDLEFVARHADAVALSFVQDAQDVYELEQQLAQLDAEHVGIVLKIETRRAVQCLPDLLLASMSSPCDGVMIARGDLAIECGYERLAEVQEEILCVCEAAHIPVIWATQVLEKLTKEGLPTRAEISDVAMATRSECVMLNKGPHLVEAVRILDGILQRLEPYHRKKRSLLCELGLVGRNEWRAPDSNNGATTDA